MNGADGLWDANVQSYHNWDSDPQLQGLEGDYWFFDGNGQVEWGVPGDLLPMAYHMGENIAGYDVWSIAHSLLPNDMNQFDPETISSAVVHIARLSGKRLQLDPR
ncbi:MAG: hypothetical protein R3F46_14495 [bacterium]